ncbi:MAG: flagellar filament capping protein FliD [Colwellia sp.]|nr:flagellar filament capping protein FliD [Colwellia sp.]NQZ80660.1 flagellar filament capping protein FliD [Colwellia sp.]
MGTITSTGLGSGLQINDIVESLVAAEKDPIKAKIDRDASLATAQISALGQVNSMLSELKSSYASLGDTSTFNSTSASSSDDDIVTATTSFGATTAVHEITVQALAQKHTLISDVANVYNTKDDVIGGGTLSIRFGSYSGANFTPDANSTNLDIVIPKDSSLEEIKNIINDSKKEYGITAGILFDGGSYRLTLQNDKSGAKGAMEITVTDLDSNNTDAAGLSTLAFDGTNNRMSQTQAAQDALIDFNGISISRDSNTIDELIDGVTFTLNNVDIKKIKINITTDVSKVETDIRAFVDSYNSTLDKMAEFTFFNSAQDKGVLTSDATLKSIESYMRSILNNRLTNISGSVKSMSDLGILSDKSTGKLSFNEGTPDEVGSVHAKENGVAIFSEVLKLKMADIAEFFAESGTPIDSSIAYVESSKYTKEGIYAVEITQVATHGELKAGNTLPADFSATPFVINESNNSFKLRVDLIPSLDINLTQGSYNSESALIAEIQSQINSDANLKAKDVSVKVSIENQKLVITSNRYGTESFVSLDSNDDSITGSAVLDFTTPPLVIGAGSTFDLSVDGSLGSIDIQGSYNVEADLITALQTEIFTKTGKTATVSILDKKLTITSDSGGKVAVSNLGASALAELGLADSSTASDFGLGSVTSVGGVGAEGTINGTAAFSDGQYLLALKANGDARGLKIEVKGGDFTYTAATSLASYPFTAPADTTFQLKIDGIFSSTLDLSGQNFTSDSDLTTAIQALLDADANLTTAGEVATASIVNGKLTFTSSSVDSQFSITATGTGAISDLGLATGSASYTTSINFSEGITTQIDRYLDAIIDDNISKNDGDVFSSNVEDAEPSTVIDGKTDSLYKKLIDLDKQDVDLTYKMELYEKRLFKQFNAMDMLVAQLSGTMNALQGALDALPGYTRDK